MPAIASGSDLLAPLARSNAGARVAGAEPGRRPRERAAPPPAIASLVKEARASAQAEAEARAARARPEDHRLAASAEQEAGGLSVDDPRFPVFPPAFPVESLIVALDRGIAAYRATQALDVAAQPRLRLATGGTGVPTTA